MVRSSLLFFVVFLFFVSVGSASAEEAQACCEAVEDVCSQCCPGTSCGCIYSHDTGKCSCLACSAEAQSSNCVGTGTLAVLNGLTDANLAQAPRKQRGVPVFIGTKGSVELVPASELGKRVFSGSLFKRTTSLSMSLNNLDLETAVRMIAVGAGVDIVIPAGLQGKVEGTFQNLDWRQALEFVSQESGRNFQVEIRENGLVSLIP